MSDRRRAYKAKYHAKKKSRLCDGYGSDDTYCDIPNIKKKKSSLIQSLIPFLCASSPKKASDGIIGETQSKHRSFSKLQSSIPLPVTHQNFETALVETALGDYVADSMLGIPSINKRNSAKPLSGDCYSGDCFGVQLLSGDCFSGDCFGGLCC
jgi:hypothetical protein